MLNTGQHSSTHTDKQNEGNPKTEHQHEPQTTLRKLVSHSKHMSHQTQLDQPHVNCTLSEVQIKKPKQINFELILRDYMR